MSDPKRHGKKRELFMRAILHGKNGKEREEELHIRTPEEFKIPETDIEKQLFETQLKNDLKEVNVDGPTGITRLAASFKYADKNALKDFDYANTLVVANLPYCLHLPQQHEVEVDFPKQKFKALVIFEKYWTLNAEDGKTTSSSKDFYAEDKVIYFNNGSIVSPVYPLPVKEGWSGLYKGINVEKVGDQNGTFRYTRLIIQFDTKLSPEQERAAQQGHISIELIDEIRAKASLVANRIIDAYRAVTKEAYIRRRSDINVHMIYLKDPDQGFYPIPVNIETAKMNRSRKEIAALDEYLEQGTKINPYELLFLDAEDSFITQNHTTAVAESFQALEVFLEQRLTTWLIDVGLSETKALQFIEADGNWRTPTRLKQILKKLTGKSLGENKLWTPWIFGYDNIRNKVLHKGYEPVMADVRKALTTNKEVVDWISTLSLLDDLKPEDFSLKSRNNNFFRKMFRKFLK